MKRLLELKQIKKSFPGVQALSGVDFDIMEGEVHAIVGENGAGKSTLIKIIAGVYKPNEGRIMLNGNEIDFGTPGDSRESGISVIYQETSLFPDFTVMENLFAGWEPLKGFFKTIDYGKIRKEAVAIFTMLNSDIDVDAEVNSLGIADKQMVEIAKALSFKSKIIIMDEPTAALSQREVDSLFTIIGQLKKQGVAVIYISHRLEEIYRVADRVTVLRDGKYVNSAPVSEVNTELMINWMVGRTMNTFYPKTESKIGDVVLSVSDLNQGGLLKDINLTVRKGEILGIAGLAGSGRTELAQAICGFEPGHTGEITISGTRVRLNDYKTAMKHGLVYVSEDRAKYGLVLQMSVAENTTLAILERICKLFFIDFKAEESLCSEYIKKLGIKTPQTDFIVENLSGGNQQKVAVARALAVEPRVLILDEPTRGVDVGAKAEIHKLIDKLAAEGMGIIMISSELPEILGMSDRIIVLRQGEITGEIMREDASQEKILSMAIQAGTGERGYGNN